MNLRGLDATRPLNRLLAGFVAVCQNVRAYARGLFQSRNYISTPILSVTGGAINTIRRLNDTTPAGPPAGYTYIISDNEGNLYCGSSGSLSPIAVGMTSDPKAMIPFRPNASVEPWMYVADSSPDGAVTIFTRYALDDSSVSFLCSGMVKVRSDGLIYKIGVKEPQTAPTVSTSSSVITGSLTVEGTQEPYTNAGGLNPEWPFAGSQPQASMTSIPVSEGQTVTITGVTGTVDVGGTPYAFNDPLVTNVQNLYPGWWVYPPTGSSYPEGAGPTPLLMVAFTDGDGDIQTPDVTSPPAGSGAIFGIWDTGITLKVPEGATQLQFGINTPDSTIGSNTGSFDIDYQINTSNIASYVAVMNELTIYYWGDSPAYNNQLGQYIWRNPNDTGSGVSRTSSTASGSSSGNSFIFDTWINDGIPGLTAAGVPVSANIAGSLTDSAVPMQWDQLDENATITGSIPVFSPAIKNPYTGNSAYENFNFCCVGSIWIPAPGEYTFVLTNKDNTLLGIGGGVTFVSGTGNWITEAFSGGDNISTIDHTRALTVADAVGLQGQMISVVSGLPLMPVAPLLAPGGSYYNEDDQCVQSVIVISFPAAGAYQIELDYDYWAHVGRILLLEASPTPGATPAVIPPISSTATIEDSYVYVYRSSLTGAQSNPSPASTPITNPSTGGIIGSAWSDDPQIDKVDYYEQNSELANYTFVGTGPNDNGLGGGQNTPIENNLTASAVATNPIVSYDNFEPFPSIDIPRSGTCSVTGGVITWLSGDLFNVRWLPGTVIEIGIPSENPTLPQIAYTLISRPTDTEHITLPGVEAGDNLVWNIPEPILAAQPMPYLFGPTDNVNYTYGVGDDLRPGTYYWCAASNLDAAPDTNQADLTDPSEALVNGAMSGGLAVLASIRRAWIIEPNFYNAEATATGTVGSIFSSQATEIPRGLYMPRSIAVEGGGKVFFRVQDGILVSAAGGPARSITDETLYPIFPHEGSTPQSVVRNGVTIYPPNDSDPQAEQFNIESQWLYWDYQGTDGNPHTLVFDIENMAWLPDSYDELRDAPLTHASNQGYGVQGVLVGAGSSLYEFTSLADEALDSSPASMNLVTGAVGGVSYQHLREITLEYALDGYAEVYFEVADTGNGSYAPNPVVLDPTAGQLTKQRFPVSPNKYKLLQMGFSARLDANLIVNIDGTALAVKDWGSVEGYRTIQPFTPEGGLGSQT